MTQTTESKILKLQKEVEVNRRKLMDASHEKKLAISRLINEWEQKLAMEKDTNKKKWEVERQELYLTLETSIKLAKDKDILNLVAGKEREIRRMRDNMNFEKENAIRVAKANTEENYRNILNINMDDSRIREDSLTKEISILCKEKESLQERISVIRRADLEKANTIKELHYSHEKVLKNMSEFAKHDSAEEYRRFRAMEQYAHDRDSEISKLHSKIMMYQNEKEALERQLELVSKLGEKHGSSFNPILAPRVISNKEHELTRRVRELEVELQRYHEEGLQQPKLPTISPSKYNQESIDSLKNLEFPGIPISPAGRPNSNNTLSSSPTPSPSIDYEDKLKRMKDQRRQLKEIVTTRENKIQQLEQRNRDLNQELDSANKNRDEIENLLVAQRETIRMEHSKEIDLMEMNISEREDRLNTCSMEIMNLRKQLEEVQQPPAVGNIDTEEQVVLLQNRYSILEKKFKKLQKELLNTESLFSQWCSPEQPITVDSNDRIMNLEIELSIAKNDLQEALEQVDAFQIRNEKLKVDYQKSRNDVDRLICQREKAIDEKKKAEDTEKDLTEAFKDLTGQISHYSNLDKELKMQREKYIRTKESLTTTIEQKNREIERLSKLESKALQVDSLKRELEQYRNGTNGDSNAHQASLEASAIADDLIKALRIEISGLKVEMKIIEEVNSKKDTLIKQLELKENNNNILKKSESHSRLSNSIPNNVLVSPNNLLPSMSAIPTSLSSIPRPQDKDRRSYSKLTSPGRHTSSSSSASSYTSYDDSCAPVFKHTKHPSPSPNSNGSRTLPRPKRTYEHSLEDRKEEA